jgi:beta-lactamase superfamily II metal-dependent hydrolase
VLRKKKKAAKAPLKVYLFNVGQGENILLELANGEYGIIDFYYEGGLAKGGLDEPPVLTYLRYLKDVEKKSVVISFICISHPDLDHIKGADTFLDWVRAEGILVRNFWMFAGTDFKGLAAGLRKAYERMPKPLDNPDRPVEINDRLRGVRAYLEAWKTNQPEYLQDCRLLADLDSDTLACVLGPRGHHIKTFTDKVNHDFYRMIIEGTKGTKARGNLVSSIIKVAFRKHTLLFGGDTGLDVWVDCLDHIATMKSEKTCAMEPANFIKASHHGSKYSSSVQFWERVLHNESCVGISAGMNEQLNHPNRETIDHIRQAAKRQSAKVRIYSTNVGEHCDCTANLPKVQVDWFSQAPPPKKGVHPEASKRHRPKAYRRKSADGKSSQGPAFVGYIFEFDPHSMNIQVARAVNRDASVPPECIFEDCKKRGFHHCAL